MLNIPTNEIQEKRSEYQLRRLLCLANLSPLNSLSRVFYGIVATICKTSVRHSYFSTPSDILILATLHRRSALRQFGCKSDTKSDIREGDVNEE